MQGGSLHVCMHGKESCNSKAYRCMISVTETGDAAEVYTQNQFHRNNFKAGVCAVGTFRISSTRAALRHTDVILI